MQYVVFLAGLRLNIFNLVQGVSSKRFVPNGKLIAKPLKSATYNEVSPVSFINDASEFIGALAESEPVSLLLLYVDHFDENSIEFASHFFPFCLSKKIKAVEIPNSNKNQQNRALNSYLDYLQTEVRNTIDASNAVKASLSGKNLSPFLLPLRNFQSGVLRETLFDLYLNLADSNDPSKSLSSAETKLLRVHPKVPVPNTTVRAFTSGNLYFKPPGTSRHGYFRHQSRRSHPFDCLLTARSRLGSPYSYTLHYDCEPVSGSLLQHYPNCHGDPTEPKKHHVNIAPSDYII